MNMINIILLALFIEAIVSAVKPIWTKGEGLTVTEIVSIVIGVVLAMRGGNTTAAEKLARQDK